MRGRSSPTNNTLSPHPPPIVSARGPRPPLRANGARMHIRRPLVATSQRTPPPLFPCARRFAPSVEWRDNSHDPPPPLPRAPRPPTPALYAAPPVGASLPFAPPFPLAHEGDTRAGAHANVGPRANPPRRICAGMTPPPLFARERARATPLAPTPIFAQRGRGRERERGKGKPSPHSSLLPRSHANSTQTGTARDKTPHARLCWRANGSRTGKGRANPERRPPSHPCAGAMRERGHARLCAERRAGAVDKPSGGAPRDRRPVAQPFLRRRLRAKGAHRGGA
ncbi:hypothetical protein EDB84DRAFT_1584723 [Lactarius hengduanensis]|nr:hypothetical protein EDB84DRAFT_1584723 [Lactarius hengduanensis]